MPVRTARMPASRQGVVRAERAVTDGERRHDAKRGAWNSTHRVKCPRYLIKARGTAGTMQPTATHDAPRMTRAHLRRVLGEPLLQFAVAGALVFGLRAWLAPPPRAHIDVGAETVAALRLEHERRRGAPATAAEEQALVDTYVHDELLYREALALGLDRGDIVIRRRLVQKMQLLAEGDPADGPDDAEVARWFAAHADRYVLPGTVSFEHVFFSGPDAPARAAAAATRLAAGADPAGLGEPFVRGRRLVHQAPADVLAAFGGDVTAGLEPGVWSEPRRSSLGMHLVRVLERAPGRPARLDEVATQAREDCARERRQDRAGAAPA